MYIPQVIMYVHAWKVCVIAGCARCGSACDTHHVLISANVSMSV